MDRTSATTPRLYECQLFRSIDDVNAAEWLNVCRGSGNMYLDPRFLKVVESSFISESRFWYALYRDDEGLAVAASCFSSYRIDVALMAPLAVQKCVAAVRLVWPGFFKFQVLLGGMPLSSATSYLAISERANVDRILASLNDTAVRLAREIGSRLISFQQFSTEVAEKLDGLLQLGFRKARSSYDFKLYGDFGSFPAYLAALKNEPRWRIRRNKRRFAESGVTCELLRGRDGADERFTPEVYQLYLNVLERAKVRLERKPIHFFQELARQYPDDSHFIFIRQSDRIVAFGCGLTSDHQHSLISVGFDYSINREVDLYFNLIYQMMEQGMAPGINVIHFGAAADEFKRRLGCRGEWLSLYAKASRPIAQWFLNRLFDKLFDTDNTREVNEPFVS